MDWDFSKLSKGLQNTVRREYLQRNIPLVKRILREHDVMPSCATCSSEEFEAHMQNFIHSTNESARQNQDA